MTLMITNRQKGERGYSVPGIITLQWRRLFISLGLVRFELGLDILVVHRITGYECSGVSCGLGPPDHYQL